MKIVFLNDDFPPQGVGGSAIITEQLAKALVGRGQQVFVVTATKEQNRAGRFVEEGLTVYRIFSDYPERWRAYKSLRNSAVLFHLRGILQEVRPDIVHAHNIHKHLSYAALKLAKELGAKVFLTAHDAMLFHYGKLTEFIDRKNPLNFSADYHVSAWRLLRRYGLRYNPFRNIIIRRYLKYGGKIFAVSHALKDALNQNGIGNVEVIHNAIDVDQWKVDSEKAEDFRKRYSLQNKKVVLFGGRLSGLKGGKQIVEAMRLVVKEIPEAVLLVVGRENEFLKQMWKIADEQGIKNHFIFTGWIENEKLKAAYSSCDVAVTPSVYLDPFNMVNLEAMACKKPVVATCFGGSPEIVLDGQTGYIVNPYDTEELAAKIIDLLKTPIKAEAFGQAGFYRLKQFFGLDKMLKKYLEYYQNEA